MKQIISYIYKKIFIRYINDKTIKYLLQSSAVIFGFIFIILGYNYSKIYYGGILVTFIVYMQSYKYKKRIEYKKFVKNLVKRQKKDFRKDTELKNINQLYEYFDQKRKIDKGIDKNTWLDLNMDDLYKIFNKTFSKMGEQVLYNILKIPLYKKEKLIQRDSIIKYFTKNKEIRNKVSYNLNRLNSNKSGSLLYFINNCNYSNKKSLFILYLFRYLPFLSIFAIFFLPIKLFVIFYFLVILNNIINYFLINKKIYDRTVTSDYFLKFNEIVMTIKDFKLEFLNKKGFFYDYEKLLKKIDNTKSLFSFLKTIPEFKSYFNIFMLDDIITFYRLVNIISENKEKLVTLYEKIGYIDALIAISFLREEYDYSKPKFTNKIKYLEIKKGINPLLQKPVSNSFKINKKHLMITGTNMSGKTTFIKTIGLNILLAQTIYTTFTEKYESSFFNLISSINIADNLMDGKSYYYMEADRIREIINKVDGNFGTFVLIDEIFKGTNYNERMKVSISVLEYLVKKNCIIALTTHDLKLEEKINKYFKYYHFSEKVGSNGFEFDYKLKEGECSITNAIKLLKKLDFPEEITEI